MKTKFWKHEAQFYIGLPLAIICSLGIFLSGLILTVRDVSAWPILVVGSIFLLFPILIIFYDKKTLSRVELSNTGILWTWLKKEICFLSWDKITGVTVKSGGKVSYDLCFLSAQKEIAITLTKQKYDLIMMLCPYPNIKSDIDNIEVFKYLHKDS